jgi:hypothetical protein
MLEAAGDPTAAGLYAAPRVESLWATVPGLQCCQHDPEDIDTSQPDHVADNCLYLLMTCQDPRYRYRAGRTEYRIW